MTTWRIQSLRFIIVGLASNLILYLIYLVLTYVGIGHKTAMTLLYLIGTLQTFLFNKHWTFEYRGSSQVVFIRYLATYGFGYLLNLLVLMLLVDRLRLPHELVQGIMIFVLAGLLFLLQKIWVFRSFAST